MPLPEEKKIGKDKLLADFHGEIQLTGKCILLKLKGNSFGIIGMRGIR